MAPKKPKDQGSAQPAAQPLGADGADPSRLAFTSAIVAALKDLDTRKAPSSAELGQRAYAKLQFDLPLVSLEELQGLAETLRSSLQLKSGEPPLALTSKLLDNVVTGARAPPAAPTADRPAAGADGAAPTGSADTVSGVAAAAQQPGAAASPGEAGAVPAASSNGPAAGTQPSNAKPAPAAAAAAASVASDPNSSAGAMPSDATPSTTTPAPPPPPPAPSSGLLDPALLQADRGQLCSAYRALCAALFVDLVSHCLALSEQDTWALLHAVGDGGEGQGGEDEGRQEEREEEGQEEQAAVAAAATGDGVPSANGVDHAAGAAQQGDEAGAEGLPEGLRQWMAAQRAGGQPQAAEAPARSAVIYEEVEAAAEDGDDFVFEDLEELPGPSSRMTATASTSAPARGGGGGTAGGFSALPPPPLGLSAPAPPYSWPALRSRLLRLSSQVSYVLLEDEGLWGDGRLMEGVFQLLRALGAHRHAQELQPLLHAYVGLVADRLAAAPAEIARLDSLWDAVGLPALAALPAGARRAGGAGGGAGGARRGVGQGVLLAEASTCLSLVASLAGQLSAASARSRLWQQVHTHVLPLLERCLGELARAVAPAPAQVAAAAKQAAGGAPAQKGVGPEEVAAIVLVCQVLDFYVVQRPGNADLAAALKATGVLASLCRLLAAAADLPGGEPLRGAALGIAASSGELHAWMWAVPGVAGALSAAPFQEGGPYEAHGAVWQLLASSAASSVAASSKASSAKAGATAAGNGATSGGSSLALNILAGGAAPEKAPRVHAFLQLLTKAASCRSGGGGRGGRGGGGSKLWGPEVEQAMREVLAALREGAGRGAAAGAGAESAAGQAGSNGNGPEAGGGGSDDDDDDAKLQLLDPEALLRRRARQLHPACWRMLKQLLTSGPEAGGKTD
ncbi:hypothetical protein HXX76_003747 [Chlamydomonas incerta]|uniref:Uncharacterized protein n=1 Tax=Chlamydomonas incerta TaxID=51695 RepID=A0A835W817_CHLIN|nr:hypothetical protein HXX76_003747 [Chlamydomonas incerta]|eukprot:KAG2440893.1 hypothetical protein HXX76_003747 [Chlamydomonas incerta]